MTDYSTVRDDYTYGPSTNSKPDKKKPKRKRCSTNNNAVGLVRHAKAFIKVLKSAEKAGFCLDEVMEIAVYLSEGDK